MICSLFFFLINSYLWILVSFSGLQSSIPLDCCNLNWETEIPKIQNTKVSFEWKHTSSSWNILFCHKYSAIVCNK